MSRNMDIIHVNGGRTGHKVHLAFAGSASTLCGFWLGYGVRNFKTIDPVTCDLCKRRFANILDKEKQF